MTNAGPVRRFAARRAWSLALCALAALAGLSVLLVARELFPYLTVNHDEGVYLQQAAMLLEGNLWLTTDHPGAFRPWFFVQDGARLYPKYSPVPSLLFAPGVAVGAPRVVLGLVAAGNVALVGLLVREAYDAPTGLLAAGVALATPFFVLISAAFLPYAPTTLLNLLFALGYVRMVRRGSYRYALLAGVAVGLAFFARPYTAVLFAAPFIVHALLTLVRVVRERGVRGASVVPTARLLTVVALLGTAGVAVTLAYNRVVTGEALLFPYQAFAPLDGPGFGYRRLLNHDVVYTPALALRTAGHLLWELATRWTVAPPVGTLLALVGLLTVRGEGEAGPEALPDRTLRLLFVGVAVSVVVGNVFFWGSFNVLADLGDPTDGFMSEFGPFYHFDLLLPLAAFGAAGARLLVRRGRAVLAARTDYLRLAALVVLVVSAPALVGAQVTALDGPVEEHAAETEKYRTGVEPVAEASFDRALVFVPRTYGPWLNHPFQTLRNGGSLSSGDVLYAQDRDAAGNFAVVDRYPERTLYRFTYQGEWGTDPEARVTPALQELSVREGERHAVETTVGTVGTPSTARLETAEGTATVPVEASGESATVEWALDDDGAAVGGESVPLAADGTETVALTVTFVQEGGSTLTYRQEVAVDASEGSVRILWPGKTSVCSLTTDCGREGTYLPDGDYVSGASVNTTVRTR
ncbi:DUF7846 domain-containing protein [Halomarina ordinaria]|uniref:Glycosyltransferase family 39 protein n=1 Tax=Halomarina ordinaria TaxID=3033939 RepID=A0ABD5UAM6_9EURY|nr:glycosyltransferase family 39 protein [Halomarina sp. PSRA2]